VAVLFGLNYAHDARARLRGCINDVQNMGQYLKGEGYEVRVYTDEANREDTSRRGICARIRALALEKAWRDVWIHFSGHGCQRRDWSGDELDGKDECIVPSDYARSGVISDDELSGLLRGFDSRTRMHLVFDCCHSGSVCDLPNTYEIVEPRGLVETNRSLQGSHWPSGLNILMVSGCMDAQTSADAYNVQGRYQYTGAMTSCLLQVLRESRGPRRVEEILSALRRLLRAKGFQQRPLVSSTERLSKESRWEM
jgi:metacaspase-1